MCQAAFAGERVWSFDFQRNEWRLCQVLGTSEVAYNDDIVTVIIGDEEIRSTAGHPFGVGCGQALAERPWPDDCAAHEVSSQVQGRWVRAEDLRVGDELLLRSGETIPIDGLYAESRTQNVYNFTIAELHNYAVGCSEVLVHNGNEQCFGRNAVQDSARPVYTRHHPGKIVDDHVLSKAIARLLGRTHQAMKKLNIDVKTWETNSRKAGYEANFIREFRRLVRGGLRRSRQPKFLKSTWNGL